MDSMRPVVSSPPAEIDDTNPPTEPCIMLLFGASGDLTRRKLIPGAAQQIAMRETPEAGDDVVVALRDRDASVAIRVSWQRSVKLNAAPLVGKVLSAMGLGVTVK